MPTWRGPASGLPTNESDVGDVDLEAFASLASEAQGRAGLIWGEKLGGEWKGTSVLPLMGCRGESQTALGDLKQVTSSL